MLRPSSWMVQTIGARLGDYALTPNELQNLVREYLDAVAADPACRSLYRDEVVDEVVTRITAALGPPTALDRARRRDQGRRGLRLAS